MKVKRSNTHYLLLNKAQHFDIPLSIFLCHTGFFSCLSSIPLGSRRLIMLITGVCWDGKGSCPDVCTTLSALCGFTNEFPLCQQSPRTFPPTLNVFNNIHFRFEPCGYILITSFCAEAQISVLVFFLSYL